MAAYEALVREDIGETEKCLLSKEFFELYGLKMQEKKLETSYREVFPKVDPKLVHDLINRSEENPYVKPFYIVEVFTKEGTDSRWCRDHILATTGFVPAIYDNGTHYVTNMRLTLEILKKLNDFVFVVEITGDYRVQ